LQDLFVKGYSLFELRSFGSPRLGCSSESTGKIITYENCKAVIEAVISRSLQVLQGLAVVSLSISVSSQAMATRGEGFTDIEQIFRRHDVLSTLEQILVELQSSFEVAGLVFLLRIVVQPLKNDFVWRCIHV
jgi:hypothetical protein